MLLSRRTLLRLSLTSAVGSTIADSPLAKSFCTESLQPGESFAEGSLGVNIAGAEFGTNAESFCNQSPGRCQHEYTYGSEATVRYFCENGLRLIRVPFRWERIQPRLRGPLQKAELHRLRTFVSWVRAAGGQAILDVHNYGRYRMSVDGTACDCLIDCPDRLGHIRVTRGDLGDLWRRLATAFRNNDSIAGYGIMNEPNGLLPGRWQKISNHVVSCIRKVDRRTPVVVSGDEWANATEFTRINGESAWVNDPTGRTVYEAHCYFDHDYSGKYGLSYEEEVRRDASTVRRGRKLVAPFIDWCQRNHVMGFIGEVGVPSTPGWLSVLQDFMSTMTASRMPVCYWAAGEWWGKYPLSIQPRAGHVSGQQVIMSRFSHRNEIRERLDSGGKAR
jgi:endoglucanase